MKTPEQESQTNFDHIVLGGGEESNFKAGSSSTIFHLLSTGLYKNKIESIVRELMCNAFDAHTVANKEDHPIVVTCDEDNLQFTIRDYGNSITKENISNVYCVYGESTKTEDNSLTGCFGIGSKSPFAYTNMFEVITWCEGKETQYVMSKVSSNSTLPPTFKEVYSIPMGPADQVGLQITILLHKKQDAVEFVDAVEKVAIFTHKPVLFQHNYSGNKGELKLLHEDSFPKLNPDEYTFVSVPNKLMLNRMSGSWFNLLVKYGDIVYPMYQIESKLKEKKTSHCLNTFFNLQTQHGCRPYIVVQAAPGTLTPTPSREEISLTEESEQYLASLFKKALSILQDSNLLSEIILEAVNKIDTTKFTKPATLDDFIEGIDFASLDTPNKGVFNRKQQLVKLLATQPSKAIALIESYKDKSVFVRLNTAIYKKMFSFNGTDTSPVFKDLTKTGHYRFLVRLHECVRSKEYSANSAYYGKRIVDLIRSKTTPARVFNKHWAEPIKQALLDVGISKNSYIKAFLSSKFYKTSSFVNREARPNLKIDAYKIPKIIPDSSNEGLTQFYKMECVNSKIKEERLYLDTLFSYLWTHEAATAITDISNFKVFIYQNSRNCKNALRTAVGNVMDLLTKSQNPERHSVKHKSVFDLSSFMAFHGYILIQLPTNSHAQSEALQKNLAALGIEAKDFTQDINELHKDIESDWKNTVPSPTTLVTNASKKISNSLPTVLSAKRKLGFYKIKETSRCRLRVSNVRALLQDSIDPMDITPDQHVVYVNLKDCIVTSHREVPICKGSFSGMKERMYSPEVLALFEMMLECLNRDYDIVFTGNPNYKNLLPFPKFIKMFVDKMMETCFSVHILQTKKLAGILKKGFAEQIEKNPFIPSSSMMSSQCIRKFTRAILLLNNNKNFFFEEVDHFYSHSYFWKTSELSLDNLLDAYLENFPTEFHPKAERKFFLAISEVGNTFKDLHTLDRFNKTTIEDITLSPKIESQFKKLAECPLALTVAISPLFDNVELYRKLPRGAKQDKALIQKEFEKLKDYKKGLLFLKKLFS